MSLLRTLLAKDLRRARRNPIPWLIQIAIPILITTMIGIAFSPKTNPSGFGRIKVAFVDEDGSWLTQFVKDAFGRQEKGMNIELVLVERDEARVLVERDKVAAALFVPARFTDDYLDGKPVTLELLKNPAQSIHPTVIENFVGLLVSGLNVIQRTIGPDLATWRTELEKSEGFDVWTGALLLLETSGRLKPAQEYLTPPLVGYSEATVAAAAPARPKSNRFAYLLLGMVGMFLLYIADNAVRDLYRELNGRTLARFRTTHDSLFAFVAVKVTFAFVMVVFGAIILLGGGMLVFGFAWHRVPQMSAVIAAYAVFAAGFMAVVAALAGNERRAAMFNNIIVTGLALAGGCMFPLDTFGPFWRDRVAPWLPTHWYLETVRQMQYMPDHVPWITPALQLLALGGGCVAAAAWLFRRRLEQGVQA
jgi:ABC-type polysaccharide/polyol phosphate export permease